MAGKSDILITRYLSGNMSPEESETFLSSLKKDPALELEFNKTKLIWEKTLLLKKESPADLGMAWEDLMKRTQKPVKKQAPLAIVWKVAAGLALIACLSVLILMFTGNETVSPQMVAINAPALDSPMTIAQGDMVITTKDSLVEQPESLLDEKKAEKKKNKKAQVKNVVMITVVTHDSAKAFLLPDNSIVFLNENSTLTYPENLGKNNRKISLIGEAYFEVKRDTMQFIVACQNTITRGTEGAFNIRGNSKSHEVEVIVVSGNAEFSGVGKKEYKKLTINEGERAVFDKKERISKGKNHRKDYKWWQKKNLKSKFRRFLEKIKRGFN